MKFVDAFVQTLVLMAIILAGGALLVAFSHVIFWGLLLTASAIAVIALLAVLFR